jgi:hypothetical protein
MRLILGRINFGPAARWRCCTAITWGKARRVDA